MKRPGMFSFLVFATIALVSCGLAVGINARITNGSGGDVKDILLSFTGGEEHVAQIRAGALHRLRLNPRGASSLTLQYTGADGVARTNKLGLYFEPGYRGRIDIEIGTNGTLTYKDHTKPY